MDILCTNLLSWFSVYLASILFTRASFVIKLYGGGRQMYCTGLTVSELRALMTRESRVTSEQTLFSSGGYGKFKDFP